MKDIYINKTGLIQFIFICKGLRKNTIQFPMKNPRMVCTELCGNIYLNIYPYSLYSSVSSLVHKLWHLE